jgi:hypothetical protein
MYVRLKCNLKKEMAPKEIIQKLKSKIPKKR